MYVLLKVQLPTHQQAVPPLSDHGLMFPITNITIMIKRSKAITKTSIKCSAIISSTI